MTTTYPLAEATVADRARTFVDEELIPWEQHAEEHGGEIPADGTRGSTTMAIELGFFAMNMPKELGGGGITMLQQVLVSEQIGRVTNALGWCVHTPAGVGARGRDRAADRALAQADDPRRAPRVLRDHRGGRGLRRRRDRGDCPARRRRVRAERREDARDVVQHAPTTASSRRSSWAATHEGEHAMFVVDKDTPGRPDGARARVLAHLPRHPPDRGVRRRARPGRAPDRRGGRRHGVHLRVVPLRAADDRRALLRRGRAADRGGDRVRARSGCSSASRSSSTRRSRTCWRTR